MGKDFDYDNLPRNTQIELAGRIAKDNLEKSNAQYTLPEIKETFYSKYGKRIIDIILSGLAIIVSLPINLIIAIVTFFDVGHPIFFCQKRMGKNCKIFSLIKFRNMTNKTDENGVLLRADKRVTKWGKFVRSTSLDELLNFYSVFKGDMSIIGPRPLPVVYEGRFNKYHELRHSVRPGLDCPLADPTKLMTWENRLQNDVWYASNVSLKTDIKLVWLLFRETIFGKDKSSRSEGFSEGTFMGYFEEVCRRKNYYIDHTLYGRSSRFGK